MKTSELESRRGREDVNQKVGEMKWIKVFKIYQLSEDGLLKGVKDHWGCGYVFSEWYYTEQEAYDDLKSKSNVHPLPELVFIIPAFVKVLE